MPSLLLLALASSSARAEDVSAAPPQMPTNTGGAGVQVNTNIVPSGGLNVPGAANVGAIDSSAGNAATRLPGQGPTAQTTMNANGGTAQAQVSGPAGSRGAASASTNGPSAAVTNAAASRESASAFQSENAAAHAPASGSSAARSQREMSQTLGAIQKAQQQDAKTGGMSAADEVRRFFHERTGGRELADPNAAESASSPPPASGGGGVRVPFTSPQEAIVKQLELAEKAESVPHDAPAHYEAALAQVSQAQKDGALSTEDAGSLASIIRQAALANGPSAMTKIARAAEDAAARGEDGTGNDFARAMTGMPAEGAEPARPASLDAWSAFIAKAGGAVHGLAEVKRELQRVRDASRDGSMERAKTALLSFIGRGGVVEGAVSGAPVPAIPSTFLSTLSSPMSLKGPSLSRPARPFEPGFSAFEGYRRLREQGVAFWPAAKFVAKTEARSVYELVMGKPAPSLSGEASDELAAKADSDYAAGDSASLASDYQALTGDRDAVAAVRSADAAKAPAARRYWLERLHDLSQRRRSAAAPVKSAPQASQLTSFASYVAAHRAEAASNVDLIEADAVALAALRPVGVVRADGRDLWVEAGVIAKGKSRRSVTLGFDSETREPLVGQIAR